MRGYLLGKLSVRVSTSRTSCGHPAEHDGNKNGSQWQTVLGVGQDASPVESVRRGVMSNVQYARHAPLDS